MKNKGLLIIVIILLIGCVGCGTFGYILHRKNAQNTGNKEKITYIYYLDNVLVEKNLLISVEKYKEILVQTEKNKNEDVNSQNENERATNETTTPDENTVGNENVPTSEQERETTEPEKIAAIFNTYSCTNNLTGSWDEKNWTFIPTEEKVSTCNLYFNKAYYDVTLTVTGAEKLESQKIERETDGVFEITPFEGYVYDEEALRCSNNKEAFWNKETSKFTIPSINSDVTCTVVFRLQNLSFELKIDNNGTLPDSNQSKQTVEFGKDISAIFTVKDKYQFDKISCTNDQVATVQNNTVKIAKLTNDTICTITTKSAPVQKVTVTVAGTNDNIKLSSGGGTYDKGSTATLNFEVTPPADIHNITCTGGYVPQKDGANYIYKIHNVNDNITCTVEAA